MPANKTIRAHYIPEVYSQHFCLSDSNPSMAYLYRKSKNEQPRLVQPKDFANKRYYYAYEKKDGSIDTRTLENLYQLGEDSWPEIVDVFNKRQQPYEEHIDNLCTFLAMMRVRVPNFRMQLEQTKAEQARSRGMVHSKYSKSFNNKWNEEVNVALKEGNKVKADNLIKTKQAFDNGEIDIAVNPQTSITSINFIKTFHDEFLKLNWAVIEASHDMQFITTDNPVVYYDLADSDSAFIPYRGGLTARGLEVIFPISNNLIAIGNRYFPKRFSYGAAKQKRHIKQFNKRLVIAAEEFIYSSNGELGPLVKKYASSVPRQEFKRISTKKGHYTVFAPTLGPAHKLPKWQSTSGANSASSS